MRAGFAIALLLLLCSSCTKTERVVISDERPPPEARANWKEKFEKLRERKQPISITANRTRTLYLRADRDLDQVTLIRVLDGAPANVEESIPVGREPISIVLNPSESRAFVSNLGDGTITVLDVSGNGGVVSVDTIKIASNLFCLVFSRTGEYLYVVSRLGDKVWVIDPEVNRVIDTTTISLMDLDVKRGQCYSGCHERDPERQRIFDRISGGLAFRND